MQMSSVSQHLSDFLCGTDTPHPLLVKTTQWRVKCLHGIRHTRTWQVVFYVAILTNPHPRLARAPGERRWHVTVHR